MKEKDVTTDGTIDDCDDEGFLDIFGEGVFFLFCSLASTQRLRINPKNNKIQPKIETAAQTNIIL